MQMAEASRRMLEQSHRDMLARANQSPRYKALLLAQAAALQGYSDGMRNAFAPPSLPEYDPPDPTVREGCEHVKSRWWWPRAECVSCHEARQCA